MEHRTLELMLGYARDLNNVQRITVMNVFVVVTVSGGSNRKSIQRTRSPGDPNGDANPVWNFPMKFRLEEAALQQNRLTLNFDLFCKRILGDKDVGEVHIPIKELLDHPNDGKQFVSYQVKKPDGNPQGKIMFSYKFSGNPSNASAVPTSAAEVHVESTAPITYPEVETAYPPVALEGNQTPPPLPSQVVDAAEGDVQHYPPTAPPLHAPPAPYHMMPAAAGGYHPPPHLPPQYVYPQQPPPGYVYAMLPPGYGYSMPPPGYGYAPMPAYGYASIQPGYGYPAAATEQQSSKNNKEDGMEVGEGMSGGTAMGKEV